MFATHAMMVTCCSCYQQWLRMAAMGLQVTTPQGKAKIIDSRDHHHHFLRRSGSLSHCDGHQQWQCMAAMGLQVTVPQGNPLQHVDNNDEECW